MKVTYVLKLADCVPSKVNLKHEREDLAEAKEYAAALFDANQMILYIDVLDAKGNLIHSHDPYEVKEPAERA